MRKRAHANTFSLFLHTHARDPPLLIRTLVACKAGLGRESGQYQRFRPSWGTELRHRRLLTRLARQLPSPPRPAKLAQNRYKKGAKFSILPY